MPKRRALALIVDSAASLPVDAASHDLMHVVPMRLMMGGKSRRDGEDVSSADFYRHLRTAKELPTTSAPSPSSFLSAIRSAADDAAAILCMTVSPRFSSTFEAASSAVDTARGELPGTDFEVMDTRSAAGGEGLVVTSALRALVSGHGLHETMAVAKEVVGRVSLLAYLDTLHYLWKGGRVRRLAHAGTALLNIKPLFELRQGDVKGIAHPRSRRRALDRLVQLTHERAPVGLLHAAVMHADDPEGAERLRLRLVAEFDCAELYASEFSPVMGVHTGPGLVGVAFWSEGPPISPDRRT